MAIGFVKASVLDSKVKVPTRTLFRFRLLIFNFTALGMAFHHQCGKAIRWIVRQGIFRRKFLDSLGDIFNTCSPIEVSGISRYKLIREHRLPEANSSIIQSHDELRVKPFGHGHRKIMIPTMNGLARHGCVSRRHEGIWYVGDSIICIFPPHKKCSAFRSRLLKRGEIANEGIEHTTGTAGIQPLLRSHTKDVKIPMWLSKPFQRRMSTWRPIHTHMIEPRHLLKFFAQAVYIPHFIET
mmetsp:Transcript_14080/g.23548  ORF Transcript_14080/g.23548 Transcript_14080/m.23548 type:complete len:239 (-) Transcript_14080:405-1121(-)